MEGESKEKRMKFEETELRLGLPYPMKRGFSDTIDLKLNLSTSSSSSSSSSSSPPPQIVDENHHQEFVKGDHENHNNAKPSSKAQVVGWPPVRSFRRNIIAAQKTSGGATPESGKSSGGVTAAFVKVSLDGAPFLRKVDLKMYTSYGQLSDALAKMFSSFTIGNCGSSDQGQLKDFMKENKLVDLSSGSDYVTTYEDKDGDWMLVGDVPWEMFVDSCKRLRITKGSEAIGLAPRAAEKCKNRG